MIRLIVARARAGNAYVAYTGVFGSEELTWNVEGLIKGCCEFSAAPGALDNGAMVFGKGIFFLLPIYSSHGRCTSFFPTVFTYISARVKKK